MSLDPSDDDPSLFWAYVVSALQQVVPDLGRVMTDQLFSPEPPPPHLVASMLADDLAALAGPVTLVLDDYHVVTNPVIDEALALLLDHAPEHLHIVIVSRAEPRFPLARMRAQGRLIEITSTDLRFNAHEAASFLGGLEGLTLSPLATRELTARTEGWIAGLQLAALSIRGGVDADSFVQSFSGNHRHVADLLVEEVLEQQDADVRDFLLDTSILDRLSGPLCDAVTLRSDSHAILRELEREQLFLVHLDDRREWYRYHHLFAEMLRTRRARSDADRVGQLHQRASAWFEATGSVEEAVQHALQTRDPERAADVVERSWRAMDRRFRSAAWLGWVEALPHEVLERRPVLSLGYGWALLDAGRIDEAEPHLVRAELLSLPDSDAPPHVADEREFASLPGTLAAARAYVAQARGDLEATEHHASLALELLPLDDPFYRGIPAVTVGMGQWVLGSTDAAFDSFAEGLRSFRAAGNRPYAHSALYAMAEIRIEQGRLAEARALCSEALDLEHPDAPRAKEVRCGLAEIHVDRGELDQAESELARAGGEPNGEVEQHWALVMARLAQARGDVAGALEWLDAAERARSPNRLPERPPLASRRARLQIGIGRLDAAARWLAGAGLPPVPEVDPGRLSEHITAAYLQVVQDDPQGVGPTLDDLREAIDTSESIRLQVEIRLLQATDHARRGETARARELRGQARHLAGAQGLVTLLREFGEPAALATPIDVLTRREREVVDLIAEGLRNKEIAARLFISLSTVKRHVANIYAKLGVTHRTAALAKIDRELRS